MDFEQLSGVDDVLKLAAFYRAELSFEQAAWIAQHYATLRLRAELEHSSAWTWPPQQARLAYLRQMPNRTDRSVVLLGIGL